MTATEDKTSGNAKARSLTGLERFRSQEAYHTSCLMSAAVSAAERLCHEIDKAVSDAYFSKDGLDPLAADVATCTDTRVKADEVSRLLALAVKHLNTLTADSGADYLHRDPF